MVVRVLSAKAGRGNLRRARATDCLRRAASLAIDSGESRVRDVIEI